MRGSIGLRPKSIEPRNRVKKEFRSLVRQIGFGQGKPLFMVAHDMGAPAALLWAADHPDEKSGLVYMECPVKLEGNRDRGE